MTYIYPVISRRAGGISLGINLNPNNACNWHCAYCQVPSLVRGVAPEIDLTCLRHELETMLEDILHGDFLKKRVPEHFRRLCDLAISGNGEPTSCREFDAVIDTITGVMRDAAISVPLRLITNGSHLHKRHVRDGLQAMAGAEGEVWIKVDSATEEGIRRINGIKLDAARLRRQVETAAQLCPTWIQTCMLAWDGQPPSHGETSAYLAFLAGLKQDHVPIHGVLLYGLARPSQQPEATHLTAVDQTWMEQLAAQIEQQGIKVKLTL